MDPNKNWNYCKILEQNEDGEIILHQNNIQALIDIWSEIRNESDPITIVSFIGPQSCGKSFFSNLFIEYIRMQSSLSWTKRVKRERLQGFSYGVEPNGITTGQLIPEKDINAIYFYPDLMSFNVDEREEFICILHVHRGDRKNSNEEADMALDALLAMMSSILVNIMWNDKNTMSDICQLVTNPRYLPIKEHLTGNVIHLQRGELVQGENKNVIHLEESSSLHNTAGLVKLSYQQYSGVNKLMKGISTFKNSSQVQATLSNILERFKASTKIINDCNGFNTPSLSTSTSTELVEVNKPEQESKLFDDYSESHEWENSPFISYLPDETCHEDPVTKSIEKKLCPIFYEIALSKVGITTLTQNRCESNSNQFSTHFHSGEIGILMNGNWVCGDDVKKLNERGEVQKFWSFEMIFNMHDDDFSDTVVINREKVNITLPILLGKFFLILKQKAENENNGKCGEAMISVPFWFSCDKHRQIREAGNIAGFDNVQLVNENTASAYFAYASGLITSREKVVVISENSNRLDMSIYSYNPQTKIICMKGQSGDYETAELSKDNDVFQSSDSGFTYLLNNQQGKRIHEKYFQSLDKMWNLVKSRIQGRFNLYNMIVLVFCESDHWLEPLRKFAANLTSSGNISVCNDSPLKGLANLFHNSNIEQVGSVECLFKNAIPFNIIITQGSQHFVVLDKKYTFFSPETQDFSIELPKSVGSFDFSVHGLSSRPRIGNLNLKYVIPPTFKITITLKRIENGIFILSSVEYVEIALYCGVPSLPKPLPVFYFDWQQEQIVKETIDTYRSIMSRINHPKTISREIGEIEILKSTDR